MFTGIVEKIGRVAKISLQGKNRHFFIESELAPELKIDQSVAHNGVCLTVVGIQGKVYEVVAIDETLQKTSLGTWQVGDSVNLERAMKLGDRLDGHIVQGHVDQTGLCHSIEDAQGSRIFTFHYDPSVGNMTIEKGSITVNGVSLTVVNSQKGAFSVAVIPYTYEHTSFHTLKQGDKVNLEFDVIGKYVLAKVGALELKI
ncbi:riboflavin synthase [Capnocytophaga gingivalis]|uniref:riboflavin synthase n=1 Tax=Capnocytophaga gingivalis TaxID=1017 RepID=UPI0028D233A1|nr:riboflavin synthase [Capnocytophaga gingivalis]